MTALAAWFRAAVKDMKNRPLWPDPVAQLGGYTASGQLSVRQNRGHFWTPIGGQCSVPIDSFLFDTYAPSHSVLRLLAVEVNRLSSSSGRKHLKAAETLHEEFDELEH